MIIISDLNSSSAIIGMGIALTLITLVRLVPLIFGIIVSMDLASIIGLKDWSYWGFVYIFTTVVTCANMIGMDLLTMKQESI